MNYDIQKKLQPNEKILWEGKPNIKLFHFCDIILLPFTTVFFGGLAYFFGKVIFTSTLTLFSLPLILLFALCVYGLVGRTIKKVRTKKKTTYYITNQRAIVAVDKRKPQIRSKYFNSMSVTNYKERGKQSGFRRIAASYTTVCQLRGRRIYVRS